MRAKIKEPETVEGTEPQEIEQPEPVLAELPEEKQEQALIAQIAALKTKLTGFESEQAAADAAVTALEREQEGLVYSAKVEGNKDAQDRLEKIKTKTLTAAQDKAELDLVIGQVQTAIENLTEDLEVIYKDGRIKELRSAGDKRLALAGELEVSLDAFCEKLGEYILHGNQMFAQAQSLDHPSSQYQTQRRALAYIHWRLSKYFPTDFHAESRERRSLSEIDAELMPGLLSVDQLQLSTEIT